MCWSIVSKTADEKTRLQAITLINDCTGHKVDLSTNGIVITDAIKYVNEKVDHLNTEEKWLLQDIKEDGSSLIAIHPSFENLITALRTAVSNEYKLSKDETSFNDTLDAFMLSLQFYKRSKT